MENTIADGRGRSNLKSFIIIVKLCAIDRKHGKVLREWVHVGEKRA